MNPTNSDLLAAHEGDSSVVVRDGRHVRSALIATYPPRCVRCNAQMDGDYRRQRLSLLRPYVGLFLFIGMGTGGKFAPWAGALLAPMIGLSLGISFYFYLVLKVLPRPVIYYGLCNKHRIERRNNFMYAIFILVSGFVGSFFVPASAQWGEYNNLTSLLIFLAAVAGTIYFCLAARRVVLKRVTKDQVWVRTGLAFLDSLESDGSIDRLKSSPDREVRPSRRHHSDEEESRP